MATSSSGGFRAALDDLFPAERFGDQRALLAGTTTNVVGLVLTVLATFGVNVLIARVLGRDALGVVTVTTQAAFVLAAGARFGMDMATVRRVAIDVGRGERDRVRAVVARAALICVVFSVAVGAAVFAAAAPLGRAFAPGLPGPATEAFRAAAVALPFAALVQVYLGGTRGLKIMRHTLFIFWMGQPLAWTALMVLGWLGARTIGVTAYAYAGAWVLATAAAAWVWRRETRGFGDLPPAQGEVGDLLRYGAPRAPAALLAQALFYTDLFVLARYAVPAEYGVYAAAVRIGQLLTLFLVSVNLMFGPFIADLHARGERDRLDRLYKLVTRWILTATLPILIVLVIVPESALRLFGEGFAGGRTALLILLAGQVANVATGSVGFILVMVGRTGWDLVVYAGSVAFDVLVAVLLIPRFGIEGAAAAGALTLAVSNAARLALVWRFLRIQPFTRSYLRLLLPAAVSAAAAWAVHTALRGAAWQLDLLLTALGAAVVYGGFLVAVGLPEGERRAVRGMARALVHRGGQGTGPGASKE